jgi:serine/threonine protein kinase
MLYVTDSDIKDENVVIDSGYRVKIIDFGAAALIPKQVDGQPPKLFRTFHGTMQYCSPEILKGCRYRGPEAEMWGLGVLLYTMIFGENPFNDPKNVMSEAVTLEYLISTCGQPVRIENPHPRNESDTLPDLLALSMQQVQLDRKKNGDKTISVTSTCIDLMMRLLDRDPHSRIAVTEALEHSWFQHPAHKEI